MTAENVCILEDETFDEEILNSDLPSLVDFWAIWCGPCRQVGPIVKELAETYRGKIKMGKLNVDENPIVATRYGIRSIPTLILFKNGEIAQKIVGAVPKKELEEAVKRVL